MQFLLILHIHSTVLHSAAAVTLVSSFWNLGWQRTIYLEHHQSLQQRERKTCTIQMLALKASAQKLHISGHTLSAKASYMATPELIGWGYIILPQGGAREYLALVIQSTTGISSKTRLNLLLIVLSPSKAYSSPNVPFLLWLGIIVY